MAFTPSSTSPVDAILMSRFNHSNEEYVDTDIEESSKVEINKAAEEAVVDRNTKTVRSGSSAALSFLDDFKMSINRVEDRINRNKKCIEEMKQQLKERTESLEKDIHQLKDVHQLKLVSDPYPAVRNRYFAIFSRDVMGKTTAVDRRITQSGNIAAHAGDPIVDAYMYKKDIRRDVKTYVMLYGLDYRDILSFYKEDEPIIELLRSHATVITNLPDRSDIEFRKLLAQNTPLGKLEDAFNKYVHALDEAQYPKSNLQDTQCTVTLAYWAYWKAHGLYKNAALI